MRVNVYAEEMTDRIEIIGKEIDGHVFTGLRFYLELPVTRRVTEDFTLQRVEKSDDVKESELKQIAGPFIHRPGDDDSSAVTFWGKRDLRLALIQALDALDKHYERSGRTAPRKFRYTDSDAVELVAGLKKYLQQEIVRVNNSRNGITDDAEISPHLAMRRIQEIGRLMEGLAYLTDG